MESLFRKDTSRPAPSVYELIAAEVAHLNKRYSVRYGTAERGRTAQWVFGIAVCAVLGLFFMDPFFYALQKSDAIRTYLYLHNYDSGASADALVASGILNRDEALRLNQRQGVYQDYFASPDEAEKKSESIIAYMNSVRDLHNGRYEQLDPIGKLRYELFVRVGLMPPTHWSGLNPSVQ